MATITVGDQLESWIDPGLFPRDLQLRSSIAVVGGEDAVGSLEIVTASC